MEYSIPVINEDGKNYFLARYKNIRFLFRRLDASCLIASSESEPMDSFEVRRNEGIIIAGDCYNLYGEFPVFLIQYSELSSYSPTRNTTTPHETLFADDFQHGDEVFSDVNGHDIKARAFASITSFMEVMDAKMQSLKNGLVQANIQMIISSNQTFIRRVENNHDALGLKTFVVPDYF